MSIPRGEGRGITQKGFTRPSNWVDGSGSPQPLYSHSVPEPAATSRFEERLRSGVPLVGDGGMGVLLSGAVARLRCPEEANLRSPESVVALHASFIRAGADL